MRRTTLSIIILTAAVLIAQPAMSAAQATLILDIKGMHCSGCASGIEAMLRRVEGVSKAAVSYERREARVQYDSARTSPAAIVEAIEKLGYKAAPKQ